MNMVVFLIIFQKKHIRGMVLMRLFDPFIELRASLQCYKDD